MKRLKLSRQQKPRWENSAHKILSNRKHWHELTEHTSQSSCTTLRPRELIKSVVHLMTPSVAQNIQTWWKMVIGILKEKIIRQEIAMTKIKVLSRYLPGWTNKYTGTTSQDVRYLDQRSNGASPCYKSGALSLELTWSVILNEDLKSSNKLNFVGRPYQTYSYNRSDYILWVL